MSRRGKHLCSALAVLALTLFSSVTSSLAAGPAWNQKLDARVRFYQMTEVGALLVGTEKSLYAVEGDTGEVLWKRKNARIFVNDIAPVAGTDLALLNIVRDGKTSFEAIDVFTGNTLWRSDRVRGAPMQMAIDLDANLLAVVVAKDAKGKPGENFKRRPVIYMFNLRNGDEIWNRENERDVEMMPAQWGDGQDETAYTLDNYHPPLLLDNRLYLFYDGVVSLDARTGKNRITERYSVNEDGLALTEADPVFDGRNVYTSGRGSVRAVSRDSNEQVWEAKDLGMTPELLMVGDLLLARTGGQFTRLKDGETIERGSYGISAIDRQTGKVLWRYKGADRGITNIALPDESTVYLADRDDLLAFDVRTGKRKSKISHKINKPAFVLINDSGEAVVGGINEVAAFDINTGQNTWRARHTPPSRGILRIITAVALRAASLYFRYGGLVNNVFRGAQAVRSVSSLRWSGLARTTGRNLTSLAVNSARERVSRQFSPFGIASRANQLANMRMPDRPDISVDVEERLLDRIDPAHQMEKLSRLLLHRRRLATLRGERMYFYTDLKSTGGRGLAGVNIHTGRTDREVRLSDLDDRFIADELSGRLYTANDNRLMAFDANGP